jgi:hypothetical protein
MKFSAVIDGKHVVTDLTVTVPRHVPYAAATMLTRLVGQDVQPGFVKRLPQAFDRPTDFTLRGVYTKGASARSLEALAYFPESQEERGRAKREYMRPGAQGAASRRQKKTEFLLTRMGALPPGWVTTPGRGAQLDGHGNIPGSVYKQIINVLQIRYNAPKPVSQRSQKAAKRLSVPTLFFVVSPGPNKLAKGGGWLPPGVWKHLPGGRISQILRFVKKASYSRRFDVKAEGWSIVRAALPGRWREAVQLIAAKFSKARR